MAGAERAPIASSPYAAAQDKAAPPLRQQNSSNSSTGTSPGISLNLGKNLMQQPRGMTPSTAMQLQIIRARAAKEAKRLENVQKARLQQKALEERKAAIAQLDKTMRIAQQQRAAAILATYGKPRPANKGRHQAATNSTGGTPIAPRLVPPPANGLEVTGELLGEGATGRVWLGRFGPNRVVVAAKVVRKSRLSAEQLGWIREEIAIHRPLRHPHICTLHGAIDEGDAITMVLSMCRGGSLCDTMGRALETNTPIGEERSRRAFCQLCGALHYCHRNGVVHRDIKLVRLTFLSRARDDRSPISLRPYALTTRALTACSSLVSTSSCAAFPLFRAG